MAPERDFQSVGLTPENNTFTRTSPGRGSGVAISSTDSTVDGPVPRYKAAFMS